MLSVLVAIVGCDDGAATAAADHATAAIELEAPTYSEHIRPLLATFCADCHTHDAVMHAGVELDTYAAARSARVRNACTAISPELVEEFSDVLLPRAGHSDQDACETWAPLSMPPGAMMRLSPDQQRMLAVWVANGAPE